MLTRFPRSAAKRIAFPLLCLALRMGGIMRRQRRIIVYYNWRDFDRKAEALADLLLKRGFETTICSGASIGVRALLRTSPDLWVGFWNQLPIEFLPRDYIFLNAEPLNVNVPWQDAPTWFAAMKNAKAVWGYTKTNAAYVATLGVPFFHVPFGYAPYYEERFRKHTEGKDLPQDIDVLFFGNLSERRRRILDELSNMGVKVQVLSRDNPAHGERLDEFVARSKIVLGIHYFEEPQAQIADLARVDHLLANSRFILHEKPSSVAQDSAFEANVATCEYRDIPQACRYFLDRPQERAAMAAKGYSWFKAEYSLDSFVPYDNVQQLLSKGLQSTAGRSWPD